MTNKVYNIDCNKYMSKCKDNEFDLAIVDPPYGINVDKKMTGYCKHWNTGQDSKKWDKKKPL